MSELPGAFQSHRTNRVVLLNMIKDMQSLPISVVKWLWRSLDRVIAGFFSITLKGASRRRWFLIILGPFLWSWFAWKTYPLPAGVTELQFQLIHLFRALFSAEIFKWVLLSITVFWLAFRISSIYLDDVFELDDVFIAERFILQAAFASKYNMIEIRDGAVGQEYLDSPIFRIGGPGKVRVYLENTALFEKVNGEPRVIGPTIAKFGEDTKAGIRPTGFIGQIREGLKDVFRSESKIFMDQNLPADGVRLIDGFERLRGVIDLRDQVEHYNNVSGRTRDGIKINAEDVRFIFNVFYKGENQENRGDLSQIPPHPQYYPFDPSAVKSILYSQTPENWTLAMGSLVRISLGEFVSKRTLGEFLSSIGEPEVQDRVAQDTQHQQEANQFVGVDETAPQEELNQPQFSPRRELTDSFYDEFFPRAEARGVRLRWIGVGSWKTSNDIVPERHQSAWNITLENQMRGNPAALQALYNRFRVGELIRLIHEVPLAVSKRENINNQEPMEVMREITNSYRSKLRSALYLYDRDGKGDSLQARRLRRVLEHLSRVLDHWL